MPEPNIIKKWEATDLKIHPVVSMWMDDQNRLHLSRRYNYVDAGDRRIMNDQVHEEIVPWGSVPKEIRESLKQINDFINSKIRQKEGLDDEESN